MEVKWLLLCVVALCLTALTLTQDGCGHRPLGAPVGLSRIVGGQEAPEGAWPWQVSIQITNTQLCGGSILNRHFVLTATHCFHKHPWIKVTYYRVVTGTNVLSNPGAHVQVRSIHKIIMHEDYDKLRNNNDVALLLLSTPLNFDDYVQPICTANGLSHEKELNFSQCFISGWGHPNYQGQTVDRLKEAEVQLFDATLCNTWYFGLISNNMICAGSESGEVDSCQGDSGGPLQCYSETEERFYLVGVTSFGDECGLPFKPGVYARTSSFATWLKRKQEIGVLTVSAAHRPNTRLTTALLSTALMLLRNTV